MGITIVLLKCGISAMIGTARKMLQLKELMGWRDGSAVCVHDTLHSPEEFRSASI